MTEKIGPPGKTSIKTSSEASRRTSSEASDRGIYGISVAADLAGTGVQNLRAYERRGLLEPTRTPGGTRLYSEVDLIRLRRITDLLAAGLNLSGIALVLDLEDDNAQLRDDLRRRQD